MRTYRLVFQVFTLFFLVHESFKGTVRLKTNFSGVESKSTFCSN